MSNLIYGTKATMDPSLNALMQSLQLCVGTFQPCGCPEWRIPVERAIEVKKDAFPRSGCKIEDFQKLKPGFITDGTGTITAGNASGINDGAAAFVLASHKVAEARGVKPLARIVSWAQAGLEPSLFVVGPVAASKKALEKAGWQVDDVDLFEVNEAYAAQSIAVMRDLGCSPDRVPVFGILFSSTASSYRS